MPEGLRFTGGCVASAHYLASAAGLEVLAAGGNAMDAALATNLAMAVVCPYQCGPGGDVFAVVWDGSAHGYLGGGRAPASLTAEAVRAAGHDAMPEVGPFTVVVPGAVRGWFDLLERFGTMSFAEVSRRAVTLARDGFVPTASGGVLFEFFVALDHLGEAWHRVYDGAGPGRLLRQPDLARTFEALAADGPGLLHGGDLGVAMAAAVQEAGGVLAVDDLAAHSGEWVAPLAAPFRGLDVLELPPPTQGVTALETLRLVERLGELPPDGAERQHLLVEAAKLALADRDAHVGEPAAMALDPAELASDAWVDARLAHLDRQQASRPEGGHPLPGGTANFVAVDRDGLCVSLIQSNFAPFGSGITVPGWGVTLHNRGAGFRLDPAHANGVGPGKRPLHTLVPAVAVEGGRPRIVFGTMGADTQPSVHLQVLVRLLDDGADVGEALAAPRWRVVPGTWDLLAEPRFGDDVLDGLAARGHHVRRVGAWDWQMGLANFVTLEDGYAVASGDLRTESAALGL